MSYDGIHIPSYSYDAAYVITVHTIRIYKPVEVIGRVHTMYILPPSFASWFFEYRIHYDTLEKIGKMLATLLKKGVTL